MSIIAELLSSRLLDGDFVGGEMTVNQTGVSKNNNNNNNTYIAPISILLFSSALKNKNFLKEKY